MHTVFIEHKKGFDIDHINRNRLDNRRANLRQIPHKLNLLNNGRTGVHKHIAKWRAGGIEKQSISWVVEIGNKHIGSFDTEEHAIRIAKKYKARLLEEDSTPKGAMQS